MENLTAITKTLAENRELDAVIVSTPPKSHPEIACYFMERETPVLCEKPLCLTVAEAEDGPRFKKCRFYSRWLQNSVIAKT